MSITLPKLTAANLAEFPDDGKRYELVGGELHVSSTPSRAHQEASKRLFRVLCEAELAGLGEAWFAPVDVQFTGEDLVQPDLLFLTSTSAARYKGSTVHGAPDLLVEVVSPSSRSYDAVAKTRLYERHGVREFWLADPVLRSFAQLVHDGGSFRRVEPGADRVVASAVLPGVRVDLDALFAEIDG